MAELPARVKYAGKGESNASACECADLRCQWYGRCKARGDSNGETDTRTEADNEPPVQTWHTFALAPRQPNPLMAATPRITSLVPPATLSATLSWW